MDRSLRYKTLFLVGLILLSAAFLAPSVFGEKLPTGFTRFFSKKVKLGLDLQGGLHIVYGVDLDKAVDDKAAELKRDVESKLAETKINAAVETPAARLSAGIPVGALFIVPADAGEAGKIDKRFLGDYSETLVRIECPADRKAKGAVCLRVSTDYADKTRESAVEQALVVIRDRVDRYGVAEPTIIKKGEDIVVELPGRDEAEHERLRSIINKTALLEFKIVDDGNPYMAKLAQHVSADPAAKERGIEVDSDTWEHEDTGNRRSDYFLTAQDITRVMPRAEAEKYGCRAKENDLRPEYECRITGRTIIQEYLAALGPDMLPPDQSQIGYEEMERRDPNTGIVEKTKMWRTYLLVRTAELTGTTVDDTGRTWNPTTNRPEVLITFNRHGARRFGDLTSRNVGRKMAIILDDRINSAPVIQSAITGGRCTITLGGGDVRQADREAQDLVNVLRTGSLPAPLVEKSSSKVGAMLGQDAIDRAQLAMMAGALLVVAIMLWFYRLSGLIANLAMVLNVMFQISILAAFQATLTLPGIAGLVLTIGIAVDSNIIIYERIREELRAGKSIRGAVDAGFSRAFWTVFDAHVTNFVAAFVLMQYGTGPIRGFAVTLLIGVICNLFTSTWVSRVIFEYYIGRKKTLQALSI